MTATHEDPQLHGIVESIKLALPDGAVVIAVYRHEKLQLDLSVWAPAGLLRRLWPTSAAAFRQRCQERANSRARVRVPAYVGITTRWARGLD